MVINRTIDDLLEKNDIDAYTTVEISSTINRALSLCEMSIMTASIQTEYSGD